MNQENTLNTPSVETEELISHGFSVSHVRAQSEQGTKDLKRPCGRYTTISTGPLGKLVDFENACACLVEQLQPMLAPFFGKPLCICGIGNRDFEFDSLGPEVAKRIMSKVYEATAKKSNFEKIAIICPDVSTHTNLSTTSIISSIASEMNAACVLTIYSCHCGNLECLCSSIQLTNNGMQTYKEKMLFSQSSLGIPVISISVPTAIRANALSEAENCMPDFFLTPSHVSEAVRIAAFIIACSITLIAYPYLDYEDCKQSIGLFLNGIV